MPRPTLSLIIPAFNEVETIGWLLDSLRSESSELHEIIVVDNASTDGTADVVRTFIDDFPQLRIVDERNPGVISARNAGFDVADGDIIGRIDADARAHPGWAAAVRAFFADADSDIGAGTGFFDQYDMPLQWVHKGFLRLGMRSAMRDGAPLASLFGANMAVRKTTWEKIRPLLLEQDGIFDDLDITLCVSEVGQYCAFVPGMDISASGRRMLTNVSNYATFTNYLPATFEARGMHEEASRARGSALFMRVMHLVFWLPSRAWNPQRHRYSVRQPFSRRPERVLPYGDRH
ncbi:glycosyltransferase family 2 protein [Williamsia sterculiae]|uniref:4,4'-diaponeurosporenoate glycosyltransferase n=1 Tax=Williamsia sterculiae TaxID=1344003 RepID=A0A1N7GQX7_9NOCA|nr:glycosyltransferase family 2 protein [Williamsia sterculiae]SIS14930.1 Glycosyl transferase family 2 [Williamsia sterculiae]